MECSESEEFFLQVCPAQNEHDELTARNHTFAKLARNYRYPDLDLERSVQDEQESGGKRKRSSSHGDGGDDDDLRRGLKRVEQ